MASAACEEPTPKKHKLTLAPQALAMLGRRPADAAFQICWVVGLKAVRPPVLQE